MLLYQHCQFLQPPFPTAETVSSNSWYVIQDLIVW